MRRNPRRTRRTAGALVGAMLVAGGLVVGVGPADALAVDVTCEGADAVLEGSLTSPDATLNGILQTLDWASAPDRSQGVMALQGITEAGGVVTGRTEPASVEQGSGPIDFFMGIDFGGTLDLPADSLDLSNILFELTPASGVTGAPLVDGPAPMTVPFPPPGGEQGPFTGTFDVTAPIGGEATWNLTRAEIGLGFRIPAGTEIGNPLTPDPNDTLALPAAVDVELGLSCTAENNPIVRALVLPPEDPDGPDVPDLSVTTPQDTPVDIDLLAGIEEGPAAPTDPASLEVFIDPAQGTLSSVADGVVTYTPNAGYAGDDTFAYLACTEPYVDEQQQEVTSCNAGTVSLTIEADAPPPDDDDDEGTDVEEPDTPTPPPPPAPPQGQAPSFTG